MLLDVAVNSLPRLPREKSFDLLWSHGYKWRLISRLEAERITLLLDGYRLRGSEAVLVHANHSR